MCSTCSKHSAFSVNRTLRSIFEVRPERVHQRYLRILSELNLRSRSKRQAGGEKRDSTWIQTNPTEAFMARQERQPVLFILLSVTVTDCHKEQPQAKWEKRESESSACAEKNKLVCTLALFCSTAAAKQLFVLAFFSSLMVRLEWKRGKHSQRARGDERSSSQFSRSHIQHISSDGSS